MPTEFKFRKGQKVWQAMHGAGVTSYSQQTIGLVRNGKVWLDNGRGNGPSGPFDAVTGKYLGDTVFRFSKELLPELPKGVTKDQIEK